jgi:TolA-binding protein|uniref:Tetratricopeptide repeat protein n=1 Tax=candidate division WOR-3 bacterium TaxID=2052148 RepID=A0A7V3RIP2_UNCW3
MLIFLLLFSLTDYSNLVAEYEIAHRLFLQENYPDALKYFTAILRKYGGTEFEDEIRFRVAECYFNIKDYENAKTNFEIILKHRSLAYLEPECLYAIGMIDILQGNYKEAEQILQKLLKNPAYQEEERANFALGVLYYFRGSYTEAKEKLEGLNLLEAKFYYGKALSRLGNPLEAIKSFKEILDRAPNTPIASLAEFSRAEALFFNKDFDGAKVKFRDFIANYPKSPLNDYAHFFYAASLIHYGDYAGAAEHLLPLTRHPDNLLAAHAGYFLGICRMNLKDGLGAVSAFQRVRANYPNTMISSYANLQLTKALLAYGDTLQALTSSAQLATMFSTGELASVGEYLTGMIYFQRKDYMNAIRFFESLLSKYPRSPLREPCATMLLYSLYKLKNFDYALTFGSKYIKDFPEEKSEWRGRVLYFLAEAYYYSNNYSEAEKTYLAVIRDYFGIEVTPYARLGLAYSLYNQDRQKEAQEIFESMSKVPYEDSTLVMAIYLGLGYTQFNQREYMKARETFEALYNTFPKDERCAVPSLFYAGMSYYNLEYYANAIESWEKLIGNFPMAKKSAEAGFRAGDTYFKALEYEKARSLFRWVVENHPDDDYARSSQLAIAQSYYNQKNYDEAIREFQKFLDLYPTADEATAARKGMEMCYYQKGLESTEAMQYFVERFPQSELAADGQYQIAQKFFDDKKYAQAMEEFIKVVVNFPSSSYAPDALLLAAECAVNIEDWQKATELYERYLNYFPKGKERDAVYFNLGSSYFNLKEYGKALKSFQVVVDSFPQSQYLANARHNVDVCKKYLGEAGSGSEGIQTEKKEE